MLTLGYITKLNTTDDNLFEVRIPIFEKAGSSKELPDLSGSYFQATVNQVPGQYNAYQVGDCVVIGFLDNHYEKPIVLGKLYLGNSPDKIRAQGFLDTNALEVSDRAVLPGNTTIGEIDYKDLEKVLRAIETLGGQITTVADSDEEASGTTVSIILDFTTNINGRVLTNFSLDNDGEPISVGGYVAYKLLYKGSTVTEDAAKIYMEQMTGSNYVPVYDFYKPKNTYLVRYSTTSPDELNGLILKPQWDSTNGLLLYKMKNIGVEANPPLGGGESSLNSIRIGDAKFNVGGSWSTELYNHAISCKINGGGTYFGYVTFNFISPYDISFNGFNEVADEMESQYLCEEEGTMIPASGVIHYSIVDRVYIVYGARMALVNGSKIVQILASSGGYDDTFNLSDSWIADDSFVDYFGRIN